MLQVVKHCMHVHVLFAITLIANPSNGKLSCWVVMILNFETIGLQMNKFRLGVS